MSEDLGTIYYDVDADLRPLLEKAGQLDRQLGGLQTEFRQTDRAAGQMQKGLDQTTKSSSGLNTQLNGLTRTIRLVVASLALREMAGWVQGYQEMAERVQMATSSQEEFEMVQRRLLNTANDSYRALEEAQELYIRTADSLRSMGYSTEQALDVTDSMSFAFVTNAASADRAAAATQAFSKSMNTGRVAADQWETITSAIPTVIEAIADASGRSAAEVRALGAAGRLTARDLSEGLRQSLEENAAATAEMANNMTDAAVRSRTAITQVLVALEDRTGALQGFTEGIITAADAMLEFGLDAERMGDFLALIETAAVSLAAVVAGRLLTSLAGYTAAQYQAIQANQVRLAQDRALAASALQRATQEQAAAQRALANAANDTLRANAVNQLAAANQNLAGATARATAANVAYERSATLAGAATRGLHAAMGLLGGPMGIVLIAAAALWTFHRRAMEARNSTLELSSSVKGLTQEMRELEKIENAKRIEEETRSLERQNKALQANARLQPHADRGEAVTRAFEEDQLRRQVAIQKTEERIAALLRRQQQLANANIPRPAGGGAPAPRDEPPAITETAEAQKRLASMRDEIELARLSGEARARLRVIQQLGSEATAEEREEAEALAAELYRLEEAQRAAEKARADATKASEKQAEAEQANIEVLETLREQLYQTTLSASELAQRQAELSLNQYATPEQIAQARELAEQLNAAKERAEALREFGDDPGAVIRGDVDPLSGGPFDSQQARFDAEEAKEQERYAGQLERLEEAKAAEIEVLGGYYALEEQMAQEHADRMNQIDQARTSAMLNTYSTGFGAIANILKASQGEQSKAYRAMFAVSQGFLVADTTMQVYNAIAKAWASAPFPANLGAVASATAGAVPLIAQVAGASFGGGRAVGGPTQGGRMYRINEGGAPEVWNGADGHQYMMANQRGEVVSNRDASSGASANVVVNLIEDASRAGTVAQRTGEDQQVIVDVVVASINGDGEVWQAMKTKTGMETVGV